MAHAFPYASPSRPRRFKRTPLRLMLIVLVPVLLVAALAYVFAIFWTPARDSYPVQGVGISQANGAIEWSTAQAAGVDFAYIAATAGADGLDALFATNVVNARNAGLRYGAEHRFSLCAGADAQAMRFIASVPRDAAMLPPVVRLAYAPDCPTRPSRDKLLSELNTFLNQIETHGGKPAIIRVSRDFDAAYSIGDGVNRTLWLEGNFLRPDYTSRSWVMWTASTWKHVPGISGPLEWDVVRP